MSNRALLAAMLFAVSVTASAFDAHKNFAVSTVATAPSPATSGTSLVVTTGSGARFPTPPFNATIRPAGSAATTANAEIVRVTGVSTDTFTIVRTQEGTSARSIQVGDAILATVTVKSLTDVEDTFPLYRPLNMAAVNLSGTSIDLASTNRVFSKSLAADTTFTWSPADGQSWTVILTNGGSYAATWPTVFWIATQSTTAPPLDTGAGVVNIFWFTQQGGITFGDYSSSWPLLSVGDTSFVNLKIKSQTNSLSGAFTIAHATNGVTGEEWSHVRWLLNGSGSDQTLTFPSLWRTNVNRPVPPKSTNGTITKVTVTSIGPTSSSALQTNCVVDFDYYK